MKKRRAFPTSVKKSRDYKRTTTKQLQRSHPLPSGPRLQPKHLGGSGASNTVHTEAKLQHTIDCPAVSRVFSFNFSVNCWCFCKDCVHLVLLESIIGQMNTLSHVGFVPVTNNYLTVIFHLKLNISLVLDIVENGVFSRESLNYAVDGYTSQRNWFW